MLRLGVVADVHVAPLGEPPARWHNDYDFVGAPERLRRAVAFFAEEGVDGVVALGDLTHRDDEESRLQVQSLLAGWDGPLWVVPGNHDLAAGLASANESADLEAPGARLAGLDIQEADDGFRATSVLPVDSWKDDLTILASHFPLISRADELASRGLPYAGDLVARDALLAALVSRAAPTVVLSGHLHVRDACSSGSLLQLSLAALVEHPFECAIVEVSSGGDLPLVTRRAEPLATVAHAERDPLLAPATESWGFTGEDWERVTVALAEARA